MDVPRSSTALTMENSVTLRPMPSASEAMAAAAKAGRCTSWRTPYRRSRSKAFTEATLENVTSRGSGMLPTKLRRLSDTARDHLVEVIGHTPTQALGFDDFGARPESERDEARLLFVLELEAQRGPAIRVGPLLSLNRR